jgi:hypothetical protein
MTTSIETNIALMQRGHFTYNRIAQKLWTKSCKKVAHFYSEIWGK